METEWRQSRLAAVTTVNVEYFTIFGRFLVPHIGAFISYVMFLITFVCSPRRSVDHQNILPSNRLPSVLLELFDLILVHFDSLHDTSPGEFSFRVCGWGCFPRI